MSEAYLRSCVPVRGSYFDPRIVGLIMAFVAAIVTVGSPHVERSRE